MPRSHAPQNRAEAFPEALRTLRVRAGLTKAAAARRAGVSRQMWWNYEAGRNVPALPVLMDLLAAVGATLTVLDWELRQG